MRALGLGVVIEVGPGSQFKVGDNVSGPWGESSISCFVHLCANCAPTTRRYDRICGHEG